MISSLTQCTGPTYVSDGISNKQQKLREGTAGRYSTPLCVTMANCPELCAGYAKLHKTETLNHVRLGGITEVLLRSHSTLKGF